MLTIIGHAALFSVIVGWPLLWVCVAIDNAECRRNDPDRFIPKAPRARHTWRQWLPATVVFSVLMAFGIAVCASQGSIAGVATYGGVLALILARFALKVAADRRSNKPAVVR